MLSGVTDMALSGVIRKYLKDGSMKRLAKNVSNNSSNSTFLNHEPCPKCGSRDNLARFDDGHGYCFGCQYYEQSSIAKQGVAQMTPSVQQGLIKVEFKDIPKRSLDEDTCRRWGYGVGRFKGHAVHVAQYMGTNGTVVAQKLRDMNKEFIWLGDSKRVGLYGQHLWKAGGNKIVLVEGGTGMSAESLGFQNQADGFVMPEQQDADDEAEILDSDENETETKSVSGPSEEETSGAEVPF